MSKKLQIDMKGHLFFIGISTFFYVLIHFQMWLMNGDDGGIKIDAAGQKVEASGDAFYALLAFAPYLLFACTKMWRYLKGDTK